MGDLPHQDELLAEEQILNLAFPDGAPHGFSILAGESRSECDVGSEFFLRWKREDIPDRLVAGLVPPNEPGSPRHANVEVFFCAGIGDAVIRDGTSGQATDSCAKRADKFGFALAGVQPTGATKVMCGSDGGGLTLPRANATTRLACRAGSAIQT